MSNQMTLSNVKTGCCLSQVGDVQFYSNIFKWAYLSFTRRSKGFERQDKQTRSRLRAGKKDQMINETQKTNSLSVLLKTSVLGAMMLSQPSYIMGELRMHVNPSTMMSRKVTKLS